MLIIFFFYTMGFCPKILWFFHDYVFVGSKCCMNGNLWWWGFEITMKHIKASNQESRKLEDVENGDFSTTEKSENVNSYGNEKFGFQFSV